MHLQGRSGEQQPFLPHFRAVLRYRGFGVGGCVKLVPTWHKCWAGAWALRSQ